MEYIIQTENLEKIYDRKSTIPGLFNANFSKKNVNKKIKAVAGINLEIKRGEFFGLLGPNGAGKTTTILMLTTLTKPSSGSAIVSGYNVVEYPEKVRENIGYVSQDSITDENLTAGENLMMVANYYGIKKYEAEKRIKDLLKLVGLDGRADELVKTYSGGMKRKIEIISAIIHIPKLLFLDEPTLGLDPKSRRSIWDYLKKFMKEYALSVFLTTHYLEEADALCDRVAVIDQGLIRVIGAPTQLKKEIGEDILVIKPDAIEKIQIEQILDRVNKLEYVTKADVKDGALSVVVDSAEKRIPLITVLFYELKVIISQITVLKPSLDDVFLKYSGHSIDEENNEL